MCNHDEKRIEELEATVRRLTDALLEVAKGEGAFNRDQLTHAENTIYSMKAIADNALEGTCPTCHGQGCGDCMNEDDPREDR